ncbi:Spo0E family sporulation regulatory protein-aspartic acid phosphatase [Clostridium sp.]
MGIQIELLRKKLEKLISAADSLVDSEIIYVSEQLDKLIVHYYLYEYKV